MPSRIIRTAEPDIKATLCRFVFGTFYCRDADVGASDLVSKLRKADRLGTNAACRVENGCDTISPQFADDGIELAGLACNARLPIGIDWRQFNARAFKSAESTTPSAVKSPPDHLETFCRQLSARLFRSFESTAPSRFESPARNAEGPSLA